MFSSKINILENSLTELTSKFFGPADNFSITFCARSEKASLKLLAMKREQKNKLSISFRQIFNEGAFGLEKSSLVNEKISLAFNNFNSEQRGPVCSANSE